MHESGPTYIVAGATLVWTLIIALLAWGQRNQIASLQADFHSALANAELRFYERVNGKYISKEVFEARMSGITCQACGHSGEQQARRDRHEAQRPHGGPAEAMS